MQEGREKAEEVLRSLREAGLTFRVKRHVGRDGSKLLMVFVAADQKRLEQEAQRLFVERWLQEEGIGAMGGTQHGEAPFARPSKPAMRVVRVGGLHYFAPLEGASSAQTPQTPGTSNSATPAMSGPSSSQPPAEQPTLFKPTPAMRIQLLDRILRAPASQGGADIHSADRSERRRGVVLHVLPLNDRHFNAGLLDQANKLNPFSDTHLESFLKNVREQFGEKIAFYYAFNVFYTRALVVPSLLGIGMFSLSFACTESQVQQILPFFAAFMAIWGSLMVKLWERRANKLALDWGISNKEAADVVRSDFYGIQRTSAVTGELELYYPHWKRALKYVLTGLVMLCQVVFMASLVIILYSGYFWIQSTEMSLWTNFGLNMANSTAWGICLELLNWIVWYQLASSLNRFENHRTVQGHENGLIIKVFIFFFIDCFLWFFILAFFHIPFGRQLDHLLANLGFRFDKPFERQVWMARLGQTIAAVLSITQWSMVFFADAYFPHFLRVQLKRREERRRARGVKGKPAPSVPSGLDHAALELQRMEAPAGRPSRRRGGTRSSGAMAALLEEATLTPYDPMLDYSGIVIQFGYVTMFSVTFSLAPFVCLLHTMFRLRSNALRLTYCSIRPVPVASKGIGLWRTLLLFTSFVSVLINCLIVSVSTDQLDYVTCWAHTSLLRESGECVVGDVSMTAKFLIAVAAEHVLLLISFLIHTVVPNQQADVRVRLKRNAFLFKKRYWETTDAEAMMRGGSSATLRMRTTSAASGFRPHSTVDYEAAWKSGSDLSDAYDDDTETPAATRRTSCVTPGGATIVNQAAAAVSTGPSPPEAKPAHLGRPTAPSSRHTTTHGSLSSVRIEHTGVIDRPL